MGGLDGQKLVLRQNMATKCDRGEIPPKIAQFFHSLPHVNFNFDNISSTFEPTDTHYQQVSDKQRELYRENGILFWRKLDIDLEPVWNSVEYVV